MLAYLTIIFRLTTVASVRRESFTSDEEDPSKGMRNQVRGVVEAQGIDSTLDLESFACGGVRPVAVTAAVGLQLCCATSRKKQCQSCARG